jgi:hypothetical protein
MGRDGVQLKAIFLIGSFISTYHAWLEAAAGVEVVVHLCIQSIDRTDRESVRISSLRASNTVIEPTRVDEAGRPSE